MNPKLTFDKLTEFVASIDESAFENLFLDMPWFDTHDASPLIHILNSIQCCNRGVLRNVQINCDVVGLGRRAREEFEEKNEKQVRKSCMQMMLNNINVKRVSLAIFYGRGCRLDEIIKQEMENITLLRLHYLSSFYNMHNPTILKLWNIYFKTHCATKCINDDSKKSVKEEASGSIINDNNNGSFCKYTAIFEFIRNYPDIIIPRK